MKISTKIWWAFGSLAAVCISVGVVGLYFSVRQSQDSKDILAKNFRSLEYCRAMLQALYAGAPAQPTAHALFIENLNLELANITEPGKGDLATALQKRYVEMQHAAVTDTNANQDVLLIEYQKLRNDFNQILALNLQAMKAKAELSEATADTATTVMAAAGTLAVLFLFSFLYNVPAGLIRPLRELTAKIGEVAEGNYAQRVDLQSNDEIGELADVFNRMAERLEAFRASNLAQALFEKTRAEHALSVLNNGYYSG